MAIRKFRKNMKPVIWAITIFFLISLVGGYVLSIKDSIKTAGRRDYALKVNGNKVQTIQMERSMYNMVDNYSKYLGDKVDKELINLIAFNDVVNRKVALNVASKLKVAVSSKEVDSEYEKVENSVGDKEQFKRMLSMQGLTKNLLKEEIKDSLLIQKTLEKLQNDAKITEQQVEEHYNENKYTIYNGKTLEEAKGEIETSLKQETGRKEYLTLLSQERKTAKIEDIDENYKEYVEKPEIQKEGFTISNTDMAKATLNGLFVTGGDKGKAKEMAEKYFDDKIKIAKAAIEKGIKVDENLPVDMKFAEYEKGLQKQLKAGMTVSEEQLKEFFDKNRMAYDTAGSTDAYIALMKIEPSEEDKAAVKTEAEKLLKSATIENFAELAKEHSQDPGSGANGGELGWFSKGDMVKPFEDAVFTGEVGKVYPELVETQFGYHIIYVEERNDQEGKAKASHILLLAKSSQATIDEELKLAQETAEKINNKEITFEKLAEDKKQYMFSQMFKDISDNGYIQGLGYVEDLAKDIFEAPLNKSEARYIDGNIVIFEKTKQIEAKKADLSEIKERVENDYKNQKAQEEIKSLVEKA